ncbi:MAG: putative efflux protein, partial [Friedmanniella sp.]|nr:putative efflux protein [Friedmanniella sp.]
MTSLTKLSLANRLIVGLVTLAIVVFGVIATFSLKQELLPSTQIPTAIVTATYPGTSPELVATDVAEPLEQALGGVKGVTKVRSTSSNGLANLTVEWEYGLDSDATVTALRNAADSVRPRLPSQTDITVQAGSTDDIPVLSLAVSSDAALPALAQSVDNVVVPALTKVTGVRRVVVGGENTTELAVTLKPAQLRRHDLTAAAVTQVIRAQALVVPAGTSYAKDTELAIQVGQPASSAQQVASWPVPTADGPVELGRLASVKVTSVDATTIARSNGRPALSLTVLKDGDADAVQISHAVLDSLPGLQRSLGRNSTIATVFDQAPLIEQSIHDLAVEGGLGLGFAVLVILVFLLSVRSTLITAISIPLSLLIAMIGLQAGSFSLNIFTLAALTVAVGRVVDDSIVVTENIKRRATGATSLTASDIVASVKEVAGAVTASTLTTVAVFLPVAVVSGVVGELFRPFALTIAVALVASLLVSMTIVPVLAFWFLRPRRDLVAASASAQRGAAPDERRVTRLQRGYLPILGFALRRPVVVLVAAALVFGGTMASATLLKTDFLGSVADKTAVQISQKLPVGTRLSATSDAAGQVEDVLATTPGVTSYLTTVGTGGSNNASVIANVGNEKDWETVRSELTSRFAERPELGEITLGSVNTQGSTSDLTVTVTGDDETKLRTAAGQVQAVLGGTPGVKDVRSDLSEERPVLQVDVDKNKAAAQGFTQSEVGQAISDALRGTQVGSVVLAGQSRDITVRSQASDATPGDIADLLLPVSQLQQQKAQTKASDQLTAKQEAATRAAQRAADQATADQRQKLVDQRSMAADSLAKTRRQLAQLKASPPPAAA